MYDGIRLAIWIYLSFYRQAFWEWSEDYLSMEEQMYDFQDELMNILTSTSLLHPASRSSPFHAAATSISRTWESTLLVLTVLSGRTFPRIVIIMSSLKEMSGRVEM